MEITTENDRDTLRHADLDRMQAACDKIAPTWPLDRQIAVNPFWHLRHRPAREVSATLAALSGASLHMPAGFYAEHARPEIADAHLDHAANWLNLDPAALGAGDTAETADTVWLPLSDLVDAEFNPGAGGWREVIVDNISGTCADFFTRSDDDPVRWQGLYRFWLGALTDELATGYRDEVRGLSRQCRRLPDDHEALILLALDELGVLPEQQEHFALAALLSVNGWASWIAYERWVANLAGQHRDGMLELLAIRLAWELVILRATLALEELAARRCLRAWREQLRHLPDRIADHYQAQGGQWLWQTAAERAYQGHLVNQIRTRPVSVERPPELQAVFCIDVRSEPYRRYLEAQSSAVQTFGFAGFFGLPIDYELVTGGARKPLLPGLLAPGLTAHEVGGAALQQDSEVAAERQALSGNAASSFGLVEATGLGFAWKLIRDAFNPRAPRPEAGIALAGTDLELRRGDTPLGDAETGALLHGILTALGLTGNFADTVLIVGHGSETSNNPHAASLNCGACCGSTGAASARLLASLLNRPALRQLLAERGISIPPTTSFHAALHNTTTDEVMVLGKNALKPKIRGWLDAAGDAARLERAPRLGIRETEPFALLRAVRERGRDWSQVRPEWGLANNAAFVVAPRRFLRRANLDGRAFLHDYDVEADTDNAVLTTILTAPMVVTHWINMQYNASVTDNRRYGSGNKVLHNVVGGHIGVFEGQLGDLRIGLAKQSVHDGEHWMHTPLRLSVFVHAPRDRIQAIYDQHEVVQELVDNEWLYLFHITDDYDTRRLYRNQWLAWL